MRKLAARRERLYKQRVDSRESLPGLHHMTVGYRHNMGIAYVQAAEQGAARSNHHLASSPLRLPCCLRGAGSRTVFDGDSWIAEETGCCPQWTQYLGLHNVDCANHRYIQITPLR